MSAVTLVQRLTSMRLPLGAFWSLGQTRCLPPRFFAPTNQFAGRWHCNACGGLPPRRALLRSLSHSFAASQANAPAITGGEIKVPRRWRRRMEARAVKPAVASHRKEAGRQDPLALVDGCCSGPVKVYLGTKTRHLKSVPRYQDQTPQRGQDLVKKLDPSGLAQAKAVQTWCRDLPRGGTA
jgi:hypothetical protein